MNIQIFGKNKCFDTKKAERYFKEHGIKFQSIDVLKKGMSKGELRSVVQAIGGLENVINEKAKDQDTLMLVKYLVEDEKVEKILENPQIMNTPIVRNGKQATLGFVPDIWKNWN